MKVDKTKIKEVRYSHESQAISIDFEDGSKYGETGNTALKTLKQLNDNGINAIDIDSKKLSHGKAN